MGTFLRLLPCYALVICCYQSRLAPFSWIVRILAMKRLQSVLKPAVVLAVFFWGGGVIKGASFSGNSNGSFVEPVGPAEMVVSGVDTARLDWGRIRPGSEVESFFQFEPNAFSVEEGESFVIGSFVYSNGENAIGSAPEQVELELRVDFGEGDPVAFVFPIQVGSTTNNDNTETSADSVRLLQRFAKHLIEVDGEPFALSLEFGATSDEGFSLPHEFNVFEGKVATAELVATFARFETFSGRSAGVFDNPVGSEGMITGGEGTDTFVWGEPPPGADPNRFHFTGLDFEVGTGIATTIGEFEYFNGSVRTGTAADTLDLMLLLEFPGAAFRSFRFPLAILSTPNSSDSEASADIVQLLEPNSERRVEVDGREFTLALSFSNSSDGGFTAVDRFFVFEDAVATADLQATLTELLPEPKPDLALKIRTAVEVEFQTFPGGRYQIQSSFDLQNWENSGESIVGDGRKVHQFFSVPPGSTQSFRVVELDE